MCAVLCIGVEAAAGTVEVDMPLAIEPPNSG